jgi:hypothetical protein
VDLAKDPSATSFKKPKRSLQLCIQQLAFRRLTGAARGIFSKIPHPSASVHAATRFLKAIHVIALDLDRHTHILQDTSVSIAEPRWCPAAGPELVLTAVPAGVICSWLHRPSCCTPTVGASSPELLPVPVHGREFAEQVLGTEGGLWQTRWILAMQAIERSFSGLTYEGGTAIQQVGEVSNKAWGVRRNSLAAR